MSFSDSEKSDGDPFDDIIEQLQTYQTPPVSGYVFVLLPVFASIFLCLFFLSVAVLVTLIRRGCQTPEHKVWLWRRRYSSHAFLCFWWSGFSSLYACFFCRPWTPTNNKSRFYAYISHPLVMNIACLGPPIFVTAMSIYWTIVGFLAYGRRQRARDSLLAVFRKFQTDCDLNAPNAMGGIRRIFPKLKLYVHSREAFLDLLQQSFLFWCIRKNLRQQASSEKTSHKIRQPPLLSLRARKARAAYGFFALHCIFFIIASFERCIVDGVVYLNIKKTTTQSKWQSLVVWLVLSSSVFLSLVLLIQWRSVTDETELEVVHASPTEVHELESIHIHVKGASDQATVTADSRAESVFSNFLG
ncbi:hypothetical protein O181_014922 [Austropuccinia psidii MF-1]|uniref:Uncharacterized protein n=1 Tax=Austropuccinia psidii MF-1 TaxID=1389203 RepID=A0A9Q3C151_9BASI|nr:hypothetical protein [Austropuccinia psidii MF-1]